MAKMDPTLDRGEPSRSLAVFTCHTLSPGSGAASLFSLTAPSGPHPLFPFIIPVFPMMEFSHIHQFPVLGSHPSDPTSHSTLGCLLVMWGWLTDNQSIQCASEHGDPGEVIHALSRAAGEALRLGPASENCRGLSLVPVFSQLLDKGSQGAGLKLEP